MQISQDTGVVFLALRAMNSTSCIGVMPRQRKQKPWKSIVMD
jgi:hypothetical protein